MRTVDARGQACPRPVIMTKQALDEAAPGEAIVILVDNRTSQENVRRFLTNNGIEPECDEVEDGFKIKVVKPSESLKDEDAAAYCGAVTEKPHVIALSSDKMGRGSDELGEVLIKMFVNTIHEASPLPSHILFYNSGVFLTLDGSGVLGALRELEARGVQLLVCGTCLQHFGKKDDVRVGTVSNMYAILETMTAAGHVISP